jgi:hypothetical protein
VCQKVSIFPSVYSTFLGIPYAINPEFVSSFNEMMFLLIAGFFIFGVGLGTFGAIGYVLRLEKKLSQIPPPTNLFCRYCGAQNKPHARALKGFFSYTENL